MMRKIKEFLRKKWAFFVGPTTGAGIGYCLSHAILSNSLVWILASIGWILAALLVFLLVKQQIATERKILEGQKEITDSYGDLLEQVNASIEYFNGYHEDMLNSVAVYSQMEKNGVEAPIANSIVSFSQEVGPESTILLIGVDHINSKWSFRIAGKSIYLNQLRAIWALVEKHLEESAGKYGTIIIKKESSIIN